MGLFKFLKRRTRVYPFTTEGNVNESAKYEAQIGTAAGWMFATCIAGFLTVLVGFITNSWHNAGPSFSGIWMACQYDPSNISEWQMDMIKGALIMATVAYGFALVFLFLYFFTEPQCITPKALVICYFFSMILFVVLTVIGVSIFGGIVKLNMSWSFGFEIIAAIFALVCIILTVILLYQIEEVF